MFRARRADGASTEQLDDRSCVICGATSPVPNACCSVDCVRTAEREISSNMGALRRLRGNRSARAERARLTARNGELTSAMLRWRPEEAELTDDDRVH